MRNQVAVAQATDCGLERKENQDAVSCVYDKGSDTHLLIVADGMGGAACGSRTSRLAVEVITASFFDEAGRTLPLGQRLNRALILANHRIWNEASDSAAACHGMGATCVVLALFDDQAQYAHVGDSRIYQVTPTRVARLTRDHSHVQRLLEGGLISEEEAQTHPARSSIERALGPREVVTPEIKPAPIPLCEGDTFVLCTDGLSSLVHDEEIFSIVLNAPVEPACATLIELAKQRGGHDNITVALARIGAEVTRTF